MMLSKSMRSSCLNRVLTNVSYDTAMSDFFGRPGEVMVDWLLSHPWQAACLAGLIIFAVVAIWRWDGNPDVFERSDTD